jgi:hypothetical protein
MQRQLDTNERHRNESEKEIMGLRDQLSSLTAGNDDVYLRL